MKKKRLLLLLLLCTHNSYVMDHDDRTARISVCPCGTGLCGSGEMTVLMLAVKENDVDVVKLLLQKGANANAYNLQEQCYVRDFNFIYNREELRKLLVPIVDVLLKLETHNMVAHHEPRMDYYIELNKLEEVKKLRSALLIDKVLEDTEKNEFFVQHSVFGAFLRHPAIKRALKNMFMSIEEIRSQVPRSISEVLVIFKEPQRDVGPSRRSED